jgi:hypothetical protein
MAREAHRHSSSDASRGSRNQNRFVAEIEEIV